MSQKCLERIGTHLYLVPKYNYTYIKTSNMQITPVKSVLEIYVNFYAAEQKQISIHFILNQLNCNILLEKTKAM